MRNALNDTTLMTSFERRRVHRRLAILRTIHEFWRENGHGPSVRELADDVGCNTTTMFYARNRLAGYVDWDYDVARSLRLTPKGRAAIGVITLADFGPDPVVRLYP